MKDTITTEAPPDEVLAEVRRIKEEIAAEHDYDIDQIISSAQEAQKAHPERIVSRIATARDEASTREN